jgi:hypothetical protein
VAAESASCQRGEVVLHPLDRFLHQQRRGRAVGAAAGQRVQLHQPLREHALLARAVDGLGGARGVDHLARHLPHLAVALHGGGAQQLEGVFLAHLLRLHQDALGTVHPLALVQLLAQFGDAGAQAPLVLLAGLRQLHQRPQPLRRIALHHPGVHARIQCTLQRFRIGVLGEDQHGHRLLGLQRGHRLQQVRRGAGRPANEHVRAQPQRVAHQVRAIALAADRETGRGEVRGERGCTGIGRGEEQDGGHGGSGRERASIVQAPCAPLARSLQGKSQRV